MILAGNSRASLKTPKADCGYRRKKSTASVWGAILQSG